MAQVKESCKEKIVQTGKEMIKTGMTVGTWGNISIRDPETDFMYISPSGMDYVKIENRHIVVLDLDLNVIDGTYEPSIEKHMHAAVYRGRKDVNAVIHTHQVFSSVFGVNETPLPAVSEDFAQIIGEHADVALPYELPGTPQLGAVALKALGTRNAVLLPRHGALSVGPTMELTMKVCTVLEKNAQILVYAKMIGNPVYFKKEEIETMQDFVKTHYGAKNRELSGSSSS